MEIQVNLNKILKKGIVNELDLERALILDRKLRLLVKEHPELQEERKELRSIIKSYENYKWSANSEISEEQIKESDIAEHIAEKEREFIEKRKRIIKEKLVKHNLNQEKLGEILGHSKTYMSELINGVYPFSMKDLIVINRLFKIKLEDLIPTILPQKDVIRLKSSIIKLKGTNLKISKADFSSKLKLA